MRICCLAKAQLYFLLSSATFLSKNVLQTWDPLSAHTQFLQTALRLCFDQYHFIPRTPFYERKPYFKNCGLWKLSQPNLTLEEL